MIGRIGCSGCKRWLVPSTIGIECSGAPGHCQIQREERALDWSRQLETDSDRDRRRARYEAEEAVRRAEHSVILAARRYGDRPTKAAREDLIAKAMALRGAILAVRSAALADKDSNG